MKNYIRNGLVLLAVVAVVSVTTPTQSKTNDDLKSYAIQVEKAHDLPPGLLVAIITQESHWRNIAGQHGEIGVAQVKPSTVRMICPQCAGNAHGTLFKYGSRGDDVARIQSVLARDGYYRGAIDGVFGPLTNRAVLRYQGYVGLKADGVVGPRTWRALFGAHDPFPGTSVVQALWEPRTNIYWAARYLVWLRDNVSPDPRIMAAAYNGGPGNPVVVYMASIERRMIGARP